MASDHAKMKALNLKEEKINDKKKKAIPESREGES